MGDDSPTLHQSTPAELQARLQAERQGSPFLSYRDSEGAQQLVPLCTQPAGVSLGRDPDATVRLDWDAKVSRLHATLERVESSWTVADDGLSTNGTFVNNSRVIGRRRLTSGDVIQVGDSHVSYFDPTFKPQVETTRGEDIVFDAELSRTQKRILTELCRPLHESGSYATPATNQEIADAVFLSPVAVKTHLRTLYAKFQLSQLPQNRKRAALAEAALRSGAIGAIDFR